jgi:hypothetical protein
MAKTKEPAKETLVEPAFDTDFSEPEAAPEPRGMSVEGQIEAIRATRAAQRKARGQQGRRRVITHYHDAERLNNLKLLAPDEVVDCEEAGLLPNPAHFYDAALATGIPTDVEGL